MCFTVLFLCTFLQVGSSVHLRFSGRHRESMAGKNSRKHHLPTDASEAGSEEVVDERSMMEIFISNQARRDEEAETRAEARRVREKKDQLEAEERAEARKLKAEIAAEEREERRKERAIVLEAERVAKAKVLEAELVEKAKVAEEERVEARALEKEKRKIEESKRQEDLLRRSEEMTRKAAERAAELQEEGEQRAARLQEEATQRAFEQQRKLVELQAGLSREAAEKQRLESQKVRQKDRAVASVTAWQRGEDLEDYLLSSERKLRAGGIPEGEWLGVVASKLSGEIGATWQELCLASEDYTEVKGAVLMGCGYTQKAAGEAFHAFGTDNLKGLAADQVLRKGVQLLRRMVAPKVLDKETEFLLVKPWVWACVGRRARAVLESRVVETAEDLVKGLQDHLASDGDKLSGRVAVFGSEGGSRRPTIGVGSRPDPGKTGVAGSTGGFSLTCFHCGKDGHKAADCWQRVKPEAGVAGVVEGASKVICFICGVEGHKATTCPKKEAQKGANIKHVRQVRLAGEENLFIGGKVNGWGASMVLDSGTQITLVPEDMVEERLKTGEDVELRGLWSEPRVAPTAKVRLGVDGMEDWEEVVALVPAQQGEEDQVICRMNLETARGLELALLVNGLCKVESAEAGAVEAVVACKESAETGKLAADRPASNPEPVTQIAEVRRLEEVEKWPDVVGWIDPEGVGVTKMLYDRETEERMAREGRTDYPGNVVWTTNPAGVGTLDMYGGKVWPKEEISISRLTVEQGNEKEKKKVKGMDEQQIAEVKRIILRKPEKALNIIMRASAVEQARLEKDKVEMKRKTRKKGKRKKPAPCAVHWTGAGQGTFTWSKVSPVNVLCSPAVPTQDWDSIPGDPKQEEEGGPAVPTQDWDSIPGDPKQEEEGGTSGKVFEECAGDVTGLRPAPSLFVGGDVGTEAPQKKKEGVATAGVALPT